MKLLDNIFKTNKHMSYRQAIKYDYFYGGAFWFIVGLLQLFDNVVCKILAAVFGVIMVYSTLRPLLNKNREEEDEMALANLNNAMKTAFMIGVIFIFIVIVILEVFQTIFRIDFTLQSNVFIAILHMYSGAMYVLASYLFRKLEDE